MLSTVIDRLADSYVEQGRLEPGDIDLAHAAAILHDQRKNGNPENPSKKPTSDHNLRMATVVRESALDDRVADAVASHMGPWYDGPQPRTPLGRLVHHADMVALTASITPRSRDRSRRNSHTVSLSGSNFGRRGLVRTPLRFLSGN